MAMLVALAVALPWGLWTELRATPFGSRSFLFGGRDLDGGVSGTIVVTVTGEEGRSLYAIAAGGGAPRLVDDTLTTPSPLALSPDGDRVASRTAASTPSPGPPPADAPASGPTRRHVTVS